MRKSCRFGAAVFLAALFSAADAAEIIKGLYTADYLILKKRIMAQLKDFKPGRFGEFSGGGGKNAAAGPKVLALTFDACGGRHSGYDAGLIEYLRVENIPATLFVTGLWMDRNPDVFRKLAGDPLFEIESHGLLHRTCSINGRTVYGVRATRDLGDVIDEMELNARKIASVTGRRPVFFRPAAAHIDEAAAEAARHLGMAVAGYDVLSGDAMRSSAKAMARNLVNGARPGAVVIMHFNRPEWRVTEALKEAVPALRLKGYTFARMAELARH